MKIKTIKKILKRTNTVKEITIKDSTPNSVTKGMFLPIIYISEIYLLTFHKLGITIIDRKLAIL